MSNASDLIKKRYGNVVQGPQGFAMPEKMARRIEEASKGLPKDFTYRRHGYNAKQARTDPTDRTEVSVITSDAVDRDHECVIPAGGDWSSYGRVVPWCHKYDELPAGFNQWIKPVGRTLEAKTQYPEKPADWGDAPWLPSAVWHFINQPVPTLGAKSIGFLPLNVRQATPSEKLARPELDGVPIIDKWMGIEYSCVVIGANPDAELIAVSKALREGAIDARLAEVIMKAVPTLPTALPSMSHAIVRPPPAIADAVTKMARSIPRTSLAAGGRTDDPHIKVMTGIMSSDPEAMAKCLKGEGPASCVMGKSMHAPMDDKDHVHIPVESPDLQRMAMKMKSLPHLADADKPAEFAGKGLADADKPGEFRHMMTLGFVHSGKGAQHSGMDDMDGVGFKCSKLTFSDPQGNETDIALTGGDAKVVGQRKGVDRINAKSMGKFAHLDFTAPEEARKCMRKGLEQCAYGDQGARGMGGFGSAGMTSGVGMHDVIGPETLMMAHHLSMGGRASPEMVRSIKAWHDGVGAKAADHADGTPMHTLDLLHGQVHGKKWSGKLVKDMDDMGGDEGGEQTDSLENPQESSPTATTPPILPSAPVVSLDQAVVHKPAAKSTMESGEGAPMVQDGMPNCPACGTNEGVSKTMATPDGTEPMAAGYKCSQCDMKFDVAPTIPTAKAVKGIEVNEPGFAKAMGLIEAGKVSDSPWAFTSADKGNAKPDDFLATDGSMAPDAEGFHKYPLVKGGQVYKRGVSAAQGRATANGAAAVADAAKKLMDALTAKLDAKAKTLADEAASKAKALAVDRALSEPFVTAAELKLAADRELAAAKAEMPAIFEAAFGEALAQARGSTE